MERTFAWLKRYRRLTVDRERTPVSCEAMVYVAMTHVMLNRLCPTGQYQEFRYRQAG